MDTNDIETRLTVLEERTRTKKKTFLDHLKEWGGVATLVVALLYTFPLGVWDRFYLSAAAREAAELSSLRETALILADIDAKFAVDFVSFRDAEMQTFYSRAMSSKKYIIITKNLEKIQKYAPSLAPAEIVLFAYAAGQAGRLPVAKVLYDAALVKASKEEDVSLISDIYRLRGALSLNNEDGVDINLVRDNYAEALKTLTKFRSEGAKLQASNSAFEWAMFEMMWGDWQCGEVLRDWTLRTASGLAPINPQVSSYITNFKNRFASLRPRPTQTHDGCPSRYENVLQ